MRLLARRTGQSMAEYAIVLTVVVTAIVAMQIYVKRGLQGKVKDVSDNLGAGLKDANEFYVDLEQYEPYYASTDYDISQDQGVLDEMDVGGAVARTSDREKQIRTGSATTGGSGALGSDGGWLGTE